MIDLTVVGRRAAQQLGVLTCALALLAMAAMPTHLTAETGTPLDVAEEFMTALGTGDLETLKRLIADDMVWHNEGDASIPWIGSWRGKESILTDFFPAYGSGAQTKMWKVEHASQSDHEAVLTGQMSLLLTASNTETGPTSWAVKVRVRDGQVVLWQWFEDSHLISKAYHGSNPSHGDIQAGRQ